MTDDRLRINPISLKVRHVLSERAKQRDRGDAYHHCHWTGCNKVVPPAMWGCREHWFRLPKVYRDRIWRCYRPGQENDKQPSEDYVTVALEIRDWIATQR